MSRFVMATLGSYGDLNPFLAIGRVLRERGHTVVIATSPGYEPVVRAAGLEHVAIRPTFEDLDLDDLVWIIESVRAPEHLVRGIVMPALRGMYDDCLQASRDASLLVSHPLTFAIPLIAEQRRLPWMSVALAPLSLWSRSDPPLFRGLGWARQLGLRPYTLLLNLLRGRTRRWTQPVTDLRRELGLPPTDRLPMIEGQHSPYGTLAMFDAPLATPQADWPVNTHVCGAAKYDDTPPDVAAPEGLEEFLAAGDAPIVFTVGSSGIWVANDFWRHAVEVSERLGRRAILLTGSWLSERFPATLPPGVRAFPWLPHSMIFPRAAAIVCSPGIGTLSQALRSGVPQLMTTTGIDQPDNARRASRLGLARVLPLRHANARRMCRELELLLGDPGYARAAQEVALRLRPVDGAAAAAEQLIACASRGARG